MKRETLELLGATALAGAGIAVLFWKRNQRLVHTVESDSTPIDSSSAQDFVLAASEGSGGFCPVLNGPWPDDVSTLIYAASVFNPAVGRDVFVTLGLWPASAGSGTAFHDGFVASLLASWRPWLCFPNCPGVERARSQPVRVLEIQGGSWKLLRRWTIECVATV